MFRPKVWQQSLDRLSLLCLAILFSVTLIGQFLSGSAEATGQITSRSITMSTSNPGTAATYSLTFTPVTTEQELIVDFCSNDPLVGDQCSFSTGTVPTISSPTSSVGTASSVGSGTPVHTIKVTGLTMTGGSPFTINFTAGITNPTTPVSFYARVLTYATAGAGSYVPGNSSPATPTLGSPVDTGGIALSTASSIGITSKVFETLTFCVYTGTCGTAPNLILGDPTTGALSSGGAFMNDDTKYDLATNAGSGVVVTMKGTTLCRPGGTCTTGTNAFTISAIGLTPALSSVGSEQFGMCAFKNGSSALTVANQYADPGTGINCDPATLGSSGSYTGSSKFGMDDSNTATTGTASTGGSQVLTSSGAVPSVTGRLAFLGNISLTTEAGVYTTSLNLVATGTF